MEPETHNSMPIACDLTAIPAGQRADHMESAERLLAEGAAEVRELPDGYAFRYAAEQFEQVAHFIAAERLCCPFFMFTLEVAPARGPIWLRITGGDPSVKELLRSNFRSRE